MMQPHPVRIVVTDDLVRSRLTVFFRAILAIPHYLWAFLLGMVVALLVLAVQSLSTLLPFTPGGVGTQQGLLVYVFNRAGTGIAGTLLLSFSVGMYIAVTIENLVIGFIALFLMLGTLRWKRVIPDEEEAYARGP